MIKIVTSGNGTQSLFSLNTNTTLFTLHPSHVILEPSLLSRTDYDQITTSPLFSTFYSILLDGEGFAPPRWDEPLAVELGITSPLQRALLSPLLRPNQPNPIQSESIPPLTLSRSRARSICSPTPTPLTTLLLPSSTRPTIGSIYNKELAKAAEETAERIMELRRAHEVAGRRLRAEMECLEERAKGGSTLGGTVLVKGFSSPSTSRSPIRPASSSPGDGTKREKSKEREAGEERGRKAREELDFADEEISRKIRQADEGIAEARGRSTSRTRRGSVDPLPPLSSPPSISTTTARGGSKGRAVNFASIEATIQDDESLPIPEMLAKEESLQDFVPHSHNLISIPEQEELSLPPTPTTMTSPTVGSNGASNGGSKAGGDAGDEDGPFEMDEDIDSEEYEIIPPFSPTPLPITFESPASPVIPTTAISSSFRPGSYRPSILSSSYAALLETSYAARRSPARTSVPLPNTSSTTTDSRNSLPPSLALNSLNISSPSTSLLPSTATTSDNPSPITVTTAKTDALIAFINTEIPDPKGVRLGREQLRDALALDSPSHRDPLPSRARRVAASSPSAEDVEDNEEEVLESDGNDGRREVVPTATSYAPSSFPSKSNTSFIGSLPISIGVAPPRTFSNTTLERSFHGESGEVNREEFIQNSLIGSKRILTSSLRPKSTLINSRNSPTGEEGRNGISISISKSTILPPSSVGPSSLAQSLRNPPASFGRTVRLEDEREEAE